MDLIDRYLVAVRRQLPRASQQDIIEELSDSLRSEAEDEQQRVGRPLTLDEQAGLLKQRGHPWLMANRYLPQQHLIGPELYPYYRQALSMVLFWVVVPITLFFGAIASIYSNQPADVWGRVLGAVWNGAIYSVGIVTIVFSILEREKVRITALDRWNPASLPEPAEGREIQRKDSVFDLIVSITMLVWWIELVRIPALIWFGGEPAHFAVEPVWSVIYFPFLATLISSIGLSFWDLIRPWRTTAVSAVAIAINLAEIVILVVLLRAGHWVSVIAADAEFADQAARAELWVNRGIRGALMIIGAILIAEILREAWTIMKRRR